nr:MAG TPA: hypothetical protein [Caudoviricetes sp.]
MPDYFFRLKRNITNLIEIRCTYFKNNFYSSKRPLTYELIVFTRFG